MILGLSSTAAPDASLDELLEICRRRGLSSLELVGGDGHGLEPGDEGALGARGARRRAAEAGVRLVGYRIEATQASRELQILATGLDAPLLLDCPMSTGGAGAGMGDAGGGGEGGVGHLRVIRTLAEARAAAVGRWPMAWEIDPELPALAGLAEEVIALAGPALQYVRLRGGGPESALHEGRGIGAAMASLALSGFSGPMILVPGSARYRVAWRNWLGRSGGWGCGSRASDPSLVRLV